MAADAVDLSITAHVCANLVSSTLTFKKYCGPGVSRISILILSSDVCGVSVITNALKIPSTDSLSEANTKGSLFMIEYHV